LRVIESCIHSSFGSRVPPRICSAFLALTVFHLLQLPFGLLALIGYTAQCDLDRPPQPIVLQRVSNEVPCTAELLSFLLHADRTATSRNFPSSPQMDTAEFRLRRRPGLRRTYKNKRIRCHRLSVSTDYTMNAIVANGSKIFDMAARGMLVSSTSPAMLILFLFRISRLRDRQRFHPSHFWREPGGNRVLQ